MPTIEHTTDTEPVMTFWRNNRLDAQFARPIAEVADQFLASRWAAVEWPLDRALRAFLSDIDGPVSAVWDSEADYDRLVDLIAANRHRVQR